MNLFVGNLFFSASRSMHHAIYIDLLGSIEEDMLLGSHASFCKELKNHDISDFNCSSKA
jgi:hypothetical protein